MQDFGAIQCVQHVLVGDPHRGQLLRQWRSVNMPRYEVNKDGAEEALAPQGGNPKVSFNSSDTDPDRKKSRTKSGKCFHVLCVE